MIFIVQQIERTKLSNFTYRDLIKLCHFLKSVFRVSLHEHIFLNKTQISWNKKKHLSNNNKNRNSSINFTIILLFTLTEKVVFYDS